MPAVATVAGPCLSVVVPVYNGAAHLERCLQSISRSSFDDFELIVIDDGSDDTSADIARAYASTVVRLTRRCGPARARNIGAMYARGSILLFVDSDVDIPVTALEYISAKFEADSNLAALFGSYDDAPASPEFISQFKNLFHHFIHQTSLSASSSFWAGCGAIRKKLFDRMDGFDASGYRTPSVEDVELGARIAEEGHSIVLDRDLQVKHLKRWTLRSMIWGDIVYRAVPWTKLILKKRAMPRDLNFKYSARFSVLLVFLLFASLSGLLVRESGLFPISREFCGVAVILSLLALGSLNWSVCRFFQQKRGLWFAFRAALMHWFYYFYSGLIFAGCTVYHGFGTLFKASREKTEFADVPTESCAPLCSVIHVPVLHGAHASRRNQGPAPVVRCVESNTP